MKWGLMLHGGRLDGELLWYESDEPPRQVEVPAGEVKGPALRIERGGDSMPPDPVAPPWKSPLDETLERALASSS
jgi:hypothetical protein